MELNHCHIGDCRAILPTLPIESVDCCVTSPPYWAQRDNGHPDQIGLEPTPAEYVDQIVAAFREVRRVLKLRGTLWLNIGDTYASDFKGTGGAGSFRMRRIQRRPSTYSLRESGLKAKDLIGVPWRVALALQADGWWLRSDIVWAKPSAMPESVADRPTKSHEYVFLLSKSERYHYDGGAIREPASDWRPRSIAGTKAHTRSDRALGHRPHQGLADGSFAERGKNARSVWNIAKEPYHGSHNATMPRELAARCILAGCPVGGTVLDPFAGTGTVGMVAEQLGRRWVGIELNPECETEIRQRTAQAGLPF